ncbi:beta-ketoacyl synthase N-terminal-like domain-containing protein [Streptomyces sp. JL2001]|uniref:beta-ketoacyl synthase N-terminal-like domain-containing protein n=1 Tax=Streptomyces sp. JL2001 TaxID=3342488 RepID=UPI003D80149B
MASPARTSAEAPEQDRSAGHIAVIGLACRFPGAGNAEAFWRNLVTGTDSITRVKGPEGVAARGLIEDPESFDAGYFGVSPREARIVNPQQRLFLECAVAALEDAGHDPARADAVVGVYGGGSENDHARLLRARRADLPSVSDWEIRVANGADFLCSRVAHKLGLTGPTVAVQAACATSLVAVHLAVRGLLDGECDLALAGGVTVRLPVRVEGTDEVGIQAPDGVLRAFDARAGGLVGGDGVGIVVLKRLADALADGDRVDAVVRGSAVNNDGAGRMGFTAPGVDGQATVIEKAQRAAGVGPDTCTYVETHGTATPLGDPVEVAALTQAFRRGTDRRGFCGIGSVKTNIGHTDAAAGVAGLIKTVLALKHGVLPPSLHFTEPNPAIDFTGSPFRVVTRAEEWAPPGLPRRAGVSSFSVGGTNAHIVLEEAPRLPRPEPGPETPRVLPLSARTPEALDALTARLADRLRDDPGASLADVAWTLQTGRSEHGRRRYAVVTSVPDAVRVLSGEAPDRLVTAAGESRPRPVLLRFVPPADPVAERAVWTRLSAADPEFRRAVEECGAPSPVADDARSCAALAFAGRYALARDWLRRGVGPAGVVGTGTHALVAAAVAGVFRPADAAALAAEAAGGAADERLAELVRHAGPRPPVLALRTAYDGKAASAAEAMDPAYWVGVLRRPAAAAPPAGDGGRPVLDVDTALTPDGPRSVPEVLGALWLAGARIDWAAAHEGPAPRKVALPTYPFARQLHSLTATERDAAPAPAPAAPDAAHGTAVRSGAATPAAPPPAAAPRAGGHSTLTLVTGLFAEILDLPDVEPDDSFFDLGGDSLIATRFVARAEEVLSVRLVPRSLFEAPTPEELAALVDGLAAAGRER